MPPRPRLTVRQIASQAGVSAASVSRALNSPDTVAPRTRQLVRQAVERLESPRADAPTAPKAVGAIGCLFMAEPSCLRFGGFDATIWSGIARAALACGVEVTLIDPRVARGPGLADACAQRHVGALAVRVDQSSAVCLGDIARSGLPAIVIAHKDDRPGLGYVRVKSREASAQAVEHLIGLGHRRIAFCRNYVGDQDHEERRLGYADALSQHGVPYDESLEILMPADANGGVTAVNRLLALPDPPTAAYFADPLPTLGAMRRLRELGLRVPEDFSIIGFDDDNTRSLGSPVYSAVCQDTPDVAMLAGQLLCRMMTVSPGGEPPRIELESYLELNGTTTRPPARAGRA